MDLESNYELFKEIDLGEAQLPDHEIYLPTIYQRMQLQTETKYKHLSLNNFFNDIKPRLIKGPVAQLVRAVHS